MYRAILFLRFVSFYTHKLWAFLFTKPKRLFDYVYLVYHGVETKYGYVKLDGLPIIRKAEGSKIVLGKGCTLVSKSKYNIAGINHPTILATLAPGAIIKIGAVGVSGATICAIKKIIIDDYSGVGANSNLYDSDFHAMDAATRRNQKSINEANSKEIIIGKDVWIASNVTILKGVHVGDEAIIAAGSVVTRSVAAKTVVAGNPARKIKDL